jgi:hypothetical protein
MRPVKETKTIRMRSTSSAAAATPAIAPLDSSLRVAPFRRLIAHDDGLLAGELFTEPVDVSLLEELQVDELGRRSLWLPSDVLL